MQVQQHFGEETVHGNQQLQKLWLVGEAQHQLRQTLYAIRLDIQYVTQIRAPDLVLLFLIMQLLEISTELYRTPQRQGQHVSLQLDPQPLAPKHTQQPISTVPSPETVQQKTVQIIPLRSTSMLGIVCKYIMMRREHAQG